MRHGVKLNRLGRKTAHRKALMSNMSISLITHKRIVTTLAKAKALRIYIEPMLTKSKTNETHNRRLVFSKLQNKEAVTELFTVISPAIGNRPGGYTRIIKLAPRLGDAAEMAMIELVDFNTIYTGNADAAADKKKTRRSRSGKKATDVAEAPKTKAPKTAAIVDTAVETEVVVEAPVEVAAEITETVADAPVVEDVVIEAVVETQAVETETVASVNADDLKIVEGIGPKIEELFHAKGILTFNQLANTSVEDMKAILDEAGPSFMGKDPGTWALQSQMAADGKWDELKAWQEELNGGK